METKKNFFFFYKNLVRLIYVLEQWDTLVSVFSFHLVENWSAIIILIGIHLHFPYLRSINTSELTDTLVFQHIHSARYYFCHIQHGRITVSYKVYYSLFQCLVEELPLTSFFVNVLFHSHCWMFTVLSFHLIITELFSVADPSFFFFFLKGKCKTGHSF